MVTLRAFSGNRAKKKMDKDFKIMNDSKKILDRITQEIETELKVWE